MLARFTNIKTKIKTFQGMFHECWKVSYLVAIYWLVSPETKEARSSSTIQEINRYPLKNLYFPLKVYDDAL